VVIGGPHVRVSRRDRMICVKVKRTANDVWKPVPNISIVEARTCRCGCLEISLGVGGDHEDPQWQINAFARGLRLSAVKLLLVRNTYN
jgi:hypothetical protein